MPGPVLGAWHSTLTAALCSRFSHLLQEEDTEAQRGEATGLRFPSKSVVQAECKPGPAWTSGSHSSASPKPT